MKISKIAAALIAIAMVASGARNAGAQTPEQAAQDLHDAEAVSKRHSAELMKIPHVTVVTGEVDAGNEAAILVEVDKQKNVDGVTRQLPSQIEGFPVEVDEDQRATGISVGHWGNGPDAEDKREPATDPEPNQTSRPNPIDPEGRSRFPDARGSQ